MKIIRFLSRLVLGFLAVVLLAGASLFVWWRFGDWTSRSIQDVEFMHETILRHHPGPVDSENPEFVLLMDEALSRARLLAESASIPSDHQAALEAYTEIINDGHLSVAFPQAILDAFRGSDNLLSAPPSSIDILDNRAWITITSFSERRTSVATLTQAIEAQADTLRSLEAIVFDLRGNGGGDSSFGHRIVRALWTEDVVSDWVPAYAAGVDWRASPENAAHVHGIAKKHADRGRESSAAYWTGLAQRIDAAVVADANYVRQDFTIREITRTLQSPVSARVIVITDGACASACLDFMDRLMALPGVIHIGEETSSDTQYIDVRRVDLPSRTGRLFIPLKVYRERLRPPGGTYVPEIAVDAKSLDWDAVDALIEGFDQEADPTPHG